MKRSNFSRLIITLIAALAFTVFLSPPLAAQQAELSQKIAELERRIEQLEALLKECGEAQVKQMSNEYGWQNKKNWRKLRIGMTEAEVKAFLGEPTKVIKGVRTLWYYPNIYCGYVSFDNDGHLTGWNEP